MTRFCMAVPAIALMACSQSRETSGLLPMPVPVAPETDLEEEFTRTVLPPPWVEGQTWTVETRVPMVSHDSQIPWRGAFQGLAHYRVLERTDEVAVLEATATSPDRSWLANYGGTWTLTFVLEPFHLQRYEFEGKQPHWMSPLHQKELGIEDSWAFQRLGVEGTLVIYSLPTAHDHLPRSPLEGPARGFDDHTGVACWWWGEGVTFGPDDGYSGDRLTHWLPGDPWWIRSEVIVDHRRGSGGEKAPARGRLVSIDGVDVEPWPWIEDVVGDPSNSPLEQAAEDGRCSAGIR